MKSVLHQKSRGLFLTFALITVSMLLSACQTTAAGMSDKPGYGMGDKSASMQVVKLSSNMDQGKFLTGMNGMTLYIFTKDQPGMSNCYGQCAVNWPPLMVKDGETPMAPAMVSGKLSTVTRKDGSTQVAYNGMPLYYWVKDQKPGDTTGQGVNNVWFVATP